MTRAVKEPGEVSCPTCWAKPGDPCLTGTRRVAYKPHGQRLRAAGVVKARPSRRAVIPSRVRRVVRRRSGGRCEAVWEDGVRCARRAQHQHHLWLSSLGGPSIPENLLDVCAGPTGCHDRIHANPALARRLGLLRRRPSPTRA